MNNIARVGGYRLYQSSYDPDEQGTILSVNHDPVGTAVSYAGYFLLIAGLIVALCQKGSRFRTLYAKLGKATLVVLFAGSSVVAVAAARPPPLPAASRPKPPNGSDDCYCTFRRTHRTGGQLRFEILRKLYHPRQLRKSECQPGAGRHPDRPADMGAANRSFTSDRILFRKKRVFRTNTYRSMRCSTIGGDYRLKKQEPFKNRPRTARSRNKRLRNWTKRSISCTPC